MGPLTPKRTAGFNARYTLSEWRDGKLKTPD